jgi:hypothetical protein
MSDEISGMVAIPFYIDQSGNLTTATPVDLPLAGATYHKGFTMPQDGCLRAIIARCETTPNTSNPSLVCDMTIGGAEEGVGAEIAVGETAAYATFANGEVNIEKDEVVGASIEQTGGTIDDAVDEVLIILVIQFGRSNI